MSFNYNKLRGRIIERYGSQSAFASEFGISNNVFTKKMNSRIRFTTNDIIRIVNMLDIPESEIGEYFFTQKV